MLALNLTLLTALAIGAHLWVSRYTEWTTPRLVAIFTGGGLLSWLLTQLASTTLDAYKSSAAPVAMSVLADRRCAAFLTAAFTVGFVWVSFVGTVEVTSAGDGEARIVTVGTLPPRAIVPGGHTRFLVATTLWHPRDIPVKVSGFPEQIVAVRALQLVPLSLPISFIRRPVVLLRPARGLFQVLANHPMILRVRVKSASRDAEERFLQPFRGNPVWIGCDADVQLRGPMRDSLAADFPNHPAMLVPDALDGDRLELRPGDQIDVQVLNADAPDIKNYTVYAQIRFNVTEPGKAGGLPTQTETLYVDEMGYDDSPAAGDVG